MGGHGPGGVLGIAAGEHHIAHPENIRLIGQDAEAGPAVEVQPAGAQAVFLPGEMGSGGLHLGQQAGGVPVPLQQALQQGAAHTLPPAGGAHPQVVQQGIAALPVQPEQGVAHQSISPQHGQGAVHPLIQQPEHGGQGPAFGGGERGGDLVAVEGLQPRPIQCDEPVPIHRRAPQSAGS